MLLAIDIGNTNCTFAVFNDAELLGQWRLSTLRHRTAEEYILALSQLMELDGVSYKNIENVIISSVVPQTVFPLKVLCRNYFHCEALVVGERKVDVGIEVKIDRPEEVGADRLVNAVAARARYGNNIMAVDFGTATNFDVVDGQGNYIGGVIAPGINLSIDALRMAAAKLPEVAIAKPERAIGKSTIGAMQSGMYWGYVGLVEGIISRIREEYGQALQTVATGGLASLYAKATPLIDHLDADLTIEGLRLIFEKNN